jgi:hypothetical protein
MKTKEIKQMKFYLTILLCLAMLCAGCEDLMDRYSGFVEGYVTGSFVSYEVDSEGMATENLTERAYCIQLEGNDDEYKMDFYTFNFPETLFDFPDGIISQYDGSNCGPAFFPDSLKQIYKIKFRYKNVDERDKIQIITGFCSAMDLIFPWGNYEEVIVKEITTY